MKYCMVLKRWQHHVSESNKGSAMLKFLTSSMVALLACCAPYDLRVAGSSLAPTNDPGIYRWQTLADAIYPEDSVRAENQRLAELARALELNEQCADGYAILSREATRRSKGALADIYDVFYTVNCN